MTCHCYVGDDETKYWFLNGKFHREDGPAIEHLYGSKDWYLNNQYLGSQKPENWEELVNLFQVTIIMEI